MGYSVEEPFDMTCAVRRRENSIATNKIEIGLLTSGLIGMMGATKRLLFLI
jgi:hypothetical protein